MTIQELTQRLCDEIDAADAIRWLREGYTRQRDTAHIRERRDFWAIDIGASGAFMVRKSDGAVFGIKGYGTPNYRKGIGFVQDLNGQEVLSYRWARGPFRTDMKKVTA